MEETKMKDNIFAQFKELMDENASLIESGKRSGFLRDERIHPIAIRTNLSGDIGVPAGSLPLCLHPGLRMKAILENCTAKEYVALTECTYKSTKDFVKLYIDTLVKLFDAGVFDYINDWEGPFSAASPSKNPFGVSVKPLSSTETGGATAGPANNTQKYREIYELPEGAVLTHHAPQGKMLKKDPKTGRLYEVDESEENKEQSEDNSGKPYNGPILEINFTGDTDDVNMMASIFHYAMNGNDDYINSNVVVSNNNGESTAITVCLSDLKHPADIISAISKMFTSDKMLGFLGYASAHSCCFEGKPIDFGLKERGTGNSAESIKPNQESVPTTSKKDEEK